MKILKQLREAATPQTRIICIESLLPYACRSGSKIYGDIPGAAPKEAPVPLLANWGAVNEMIYNLDMVVSLMNFLSNINETTNNYPVRCYYSSIPWSGQFINLTRFLNVLVGRSRT